MVLVCLHVHVCEPAIQRRSHFDAVSIALRLTGTTVCADDDDVAFTVVEASIYNNYNDSLLVVKPTCTRVCGIWSFWCMVYVMCIMCSLKTCK